MNTRTISRFLTLALGVLAGTFSGIGLVFAVPSAHLVALLVGVTALRAKIDLPKPARLGAFTIGGVLGLLLTAEVWFINDGYPTPAATAVHSLLFAVCVVIVHWLDIKEHFARRHALQS